MADFITQIDQIVANTKEKMLAVVKNSIQEVIIESQKTVGEGGKMRVDTGFLRWSGVADIGKIPTGPGAGVERQEGQQGVLPQYADTRADETNLVLAKMKIGDIFYFGWTANYAEYRELKDAFLESALQKWQSFVDASVARLKK